MKIEIFLLQTWEKGWNYANYNSDFLQQNLEIHSSQGQFKTPIESIFNNNILNSFMQCAYIPKKKEKLNYKPGEYLFFKVFKTLKLKFAEHQSHKFSIFKFSFYF